MNCYIWPAKAYQESLHSVATEETKSKAKEEELKADDPEEDKRDAESIIR